MTRYHVAASSVLFLVALSACGNRHIPVEQDLGHPMDDAGDDVALDGGADAQTTPICMTQLADRWGAEGLRPFDLAADSRGQTHVVAIRGTGTASDTAELVYLTRAAQPMGTRIIDNYVGSAALAVASDGAAHILYVENLDGDRKTPRSLRHVHFDSAGHQAAAGVISPRALVAFDIATLPTGSTYVAFGSTPPSGSHELGHRFEIATRVDSPTGWLIETLDKERGIPVGVDLAVRSDAAVYVSVGESMANHEVFLRTTPGKPWVKTVLSTWSDYYARQALAEAGSRVHALVRDGSMIHFATHHSGAQSWRKEAIFTDLKKADYPTLTVDSHDRARILYFDLTTTPSTLRRMTHHGSGGFSDSVPIPSSQGVASPVAVIDNVNNLHLVYVRHDGFMGYQRICLDD